VSLGVSRRPCLARNALKIKYLMYMAVQLRP